jgi:hypothetical protein
MRHENAYQILIAEEPGSGGANAKPAIFLPDQGSGMTVGT